MKSIKNYSEQMKKSVSLTPPPLRGGKKFALVTFPFVLFFLFYFGIVLFTDQQFCFRDAGSCFYPIFKQAQEEWNRGNIPLWDCYENLGQPLAANPLCSLFYPLKGIFFLTLLFPASFGICFKCYILLHYPLAYWGIYRLARHWRFSVAASVMAAMVYTFSTPFFFLYSNLIYLISGAWLPFALLEGDKILREGGIAPILRLGIILALMVLGGDPEGAYLSGLILFGLFLTYRHYGLLRTITNSTCPAGIRSDKSEPKISKRKWQNRPIFFFPIRLLLSALLAFALTAVIVLPAGQAAGLSSRNEQATVHSLWQIPGRLVKQVSENKDSTAPTELQGYRPDVCKVGFLDGLLCLDHENGINSMERYGFSLQPWDLPEIIFPSLTGNYLQNFEWTIKYPGNELYYPTIYMGIIPAILVFFALLFRRKKKRKSEFSREELSRRSDSKSSAKINTSDSGTTTAGSSDDHYREDPSHCTERNSDLQSALRSWGTWLILLMLIGALGAFGPIWFFRAFRALLGHEENLKITNGDPVGGIYWLATVLLPIFHQFRFPAKLIIYMAFGFSLMAGIGWDRFFTTFSFTGKSSAPQKRNVRFERTGVSQTEKKARKNIETPSPDSPPVQNDALQDNFAKLKKICKIILMLSAAVFLLLYLIGPERLTGYKPGEIFPSSFEPKDAMTVIAGAILQPVIVIILFLLLLRFRQSGTLRNRIFPTLMFLLIICDLIYANRNLTVTRSERDFCQEPAMAQVIHARQKSQNKNNQQSSEQKSANSWESQNRHKKGENLLHKDAAVKENSFDKSGINNEKSNINNSEICEAETSEAERSEAERKSNSLIPPRIYYTYWDNPKAYDKLPPKLFYLYTDWRQKSLAPKFTNIEHIGSLQKISVTLMPSMTRQVDEGIEGLLYPNIPEDYKERYQEILAALNIEYLVVSTAKPISDKLELVDGASKLTDPPDVQAKKQKELEERDWPMEIALMKIRHQPKYARIKRTFFKSNKSFALDRLLDDFSPKELERLPGEKAFVTEYSSTRIRMSVSLKKPGSIVVAEQYWPGWTALAVPKSSEQKPFSVELKPDHGVLRKFALPAGDFEIVMEYKPKLFFIGAVLSVVSWLTVFLLFGCLRFQRKNARDA